MKEKPTTVRLGNLSSFINERIKGLSTQAHRVSISEYLRMLILLDQEKDILTNKNNVQSIPTVIQENKVNSDCSTDEYSWLPIQLGGGN